MTVSLKLEGLYPEVVTPLDGNGAILEREFIMYVQQLARVGWIAGGVVVNGTLAERPDLTPEERVRLVERARVAAPADFDVIVAVDADDAEGAVSAVNQAAEAGATAALLRPPAKTARALVETVDAEATLPLVIRVGADVDAETLTQLGGLGSVSAICTDGGDFAAQHAAIGESAAHLTAADDASLVDHLVGGADGALMATAGVGTVAWAKLLRLCRDGEADQARALFDGQLAGLGPALRGGQDAPRGVLVKEALVLQGLISTAGMRGGDVADDAQREDVRTALVAAGLLPG